MTDRMAALTTLSLHERPERAAALDDFYARYAGDPLIIDKWLTLQATIPERDDARPRQGAHRASRVLVRQPQSRARPDPRFRAGQSTKFNRPDGAGYDFVVETVLAIDPKNPQVAARLLSALKSWRALEAGRRARPRPRCSASQATPSLSRDVGDIVQRALARVKPLIDSPILSPHALWRACSGRRKSPRRRPHFRAAARTVHLSRSGAKLLLRNIANSLNRKPSTNRHLSIPIESDSERCGTSFR